MKTNKISIVSFILSVLPFLSLILAILHLSLPDNINSMMAIANIISVLSAFVLAITQIVNKEKRNGLSIVVFIISGGHFLIIAGILIFALIYNVTL